jgi:hypothetical protein
MYELKTKLNDMSVKEYINSIENEKRKKDAISLMDIIKDITTDPPKMWGSSIVGYGNIKYTNSVKKEYDWFKFGFSPRKNALTLYLSAYSDYIYQLSDTMGLKHGKGCVYIKDIDKVDSKLIVLMIKHTINNGGSYGS